MHRKEKNMKLKRTIASLSALALLVGGVTGCKKAEETGAGEPVTLKYVMPGPGMQEDSQKVWAAFNEKLHEKLPNVTVEFEVIPTSEYNKKFNLMCTAREQIDIVNAYWLGDSKQARNGTFEPLDDLLKKYGKDITNTLPEWLMEYGKVDGQIYTIPSYQMCGSFRGIVFIKEQAEKYLDIEKFKEALWSTPTFNQETYDILTKYMEDLKANGINFKSATVMSMKGRENITGHDYAIDYLDEKAQLKANYIDEVSKMRYKVAREWAEKGFIRPDELSATDDESYKGKVDGYPFWDVTYTPFLEESLSEKYGVDVLVIPYENYYYTGFNNSASGTAIMSTSKYKEQAMQVINLLQTDKELYNLLVFGIEGDHYTKIGEDRISTATNESPTSNDRYGLYKWIVGNTSMAYDLETEPEEYKKWVFEEANMSDKRSPLIGFKPDTEPVADYITQVSSVRDKYEQPLLTGSIEDWEAFYEEFKTQMNKVGNEQVLEELQRQIDEFLKTK